MPKLSIYEDPQAAVPVGECARCGGEMYSGEEGEICHDCRKELDRHCEDEEGENRS